MLLSNYFLNISSAKSIPYLKNYNILNPFKNFSSDLDKIPHRICRQELSSERKLRVNGQSGNHTFLEAEINFLLAFNVGGPIVAKFDIRNLTKLLLIIVIT